ncbi:MAG: carbohydrate porin [Candidatus Omnitrophica bacterium]|nr:carbohydrate porin [Candidatus Omnitrophota bacterium]
MKRQIIFLLGFIFAAAPLAFAAVSGADHSEKHFTQTHHLSHDERYLTGDWKDERAKLSDKGIDFKSSYVFDVLGNPVGGNFQGMRYNHSMGLDINVDFEKACGFKGSQFHVSGLWRAGRNLSSQVIGNELVVSSIYGHQQFRFYNLTWEQMFLEDKFSIKFGRMAAQDDFIVSPLYWFFVTNAIDGMPINIPKNFNFTVYPEATWGARVKLEIAPEFSSMTGIYNGNPHLGKDKYHGLDFGLRLSKGIFFMQEFNLTPKIKTNYCPEGLPGRVSVGGYWHTATYFDLYADDNGASFAYTGNSARKRIGNYGFYAHIEQMLFKEPSVEGAPEQGFIPFIAPNWAPGNINKYPFFVDGGFVWTGPIPGRDYDAAGIGVSYMAWSKDLTSTQEFQSDSGMSIHPGKYEMSVDFTYSAQITKWLFIQPDIQWIINPGGSPKIPDALVVGSRFKIIF